MLRLSWADVETMIAMLSRRLDVEPDALVVGVARGGLIPATLLAQRLGVRRVASLGLYSYAEGEFGERGPLKSYGDVPSEAALVIDDIVDSGATFARAMSLCPKAKLAALVDRGPGKRLGVVSALQVSDGQWVEFPWEVEDGA